MIYILANFQLLKTSALQLKIPLLGYATTLLTCLVQTLPYNNFHQH